MTPPLRIAVIGTGRWGSRIIETLETLPACIITHRATHNYKELLHKSDIDGIVIATPASTHAIIAQDFIKKGIPLFIEKPLTANLKEAQALNTLAKKHHASIFVGHIHCYNSAYRTLKVQSKKIGDIRTIFAESMSAGPVRSDVSVLWDWAPHDTYLMIDLLKKNPTSVQAWGTTSLQTNKNHYDSTAIKLTFPGNVTGILTNSWVSPEKRKHFTVIGTKGSLVFDDAKKEDKVIHYTPKKPQGTPLAYENTMPLTNELSAWLTSIKTNKKPATGIEAGLLVVKILTAAEQSIQKNGESVKISSTS